jgi:hypothetical protein
LLLCNDPNIEDKESFVPENRKATAKERRTIRKATLAVRNDATVKTVKITRLISVRYLT